MQMWYFSTIVGCEFTSTTMAIMSKAGLLQLFCYIIMFFLSIQTKAIEIFCQTCQKVIVISEYGSCLHCGTDLTHFLIDVPYTATNNPDCKNNIRTGQIIPFSNFNSEYAIQRVNGLLNKKHPAIIKKSNIGYEIVTIREKIKKKLEARPYSNLDLIHQSVLSNGFRQVPIQGGLFYRDSTIKLAQWISEQSKSRTFNLLFVFTTEPYAEEFISDYHLLFVHVEKNHATIILPADDNNSFISLDFTVEITQQLIEEYFRSTIFSQLFIYHQTSRLDQRKTRSRKK